MRIAIFSDSYLPGVGGTENAVLYYCKELAIDNEVVLFAPTYKKPFSDDFNFRTIRIKSKQITKNDSVALPNLCKKTKEALKEFKPDIIHTMTLGPIFKYAIKYAKKNKIKVVSTVHTKYLYCYKRAIHIPLLAKIIVHSFAKYLNNADCVCSVSHDMQNELKSYGLKKEIVVIKNGGIRRNNSFVKSENEIINFLFVGLIIKYKNIKFTIDALDIVKKKGYNFIFNIVGDGQDRKYFEKYVAKKQLSDCIKFLGRTTDSKKLDKLYAENDLFLFPSVFDNDPLVVCEAGNMGTPSLVIEGTGASERINDGENGFTSKYGVEDFAEKIIYFINHRDKLKDAGKEAKNLFTSWQDNKKEYLTLYKKLLNKEANNGNL